jgi:hypothetical protein
VNLHHEGDAAEAPCGHFTYEFQGECRTARGAEPMDIREPTSSLTGDWK